VPSSALDRLSRVTAEVRYIKQHTAEKCAFVCPRSSEPHYGRVGVFKQHTAEKVCPCVPSSGTVGLTATAVQLHSPGWHPRVAGDPQMLFLRSAKTAVLCGLFFLALTGIPAHPQNTIKVIGSNIATGKTPPAQAVDEAKVFASIAPKYPMSQKTWHWIIVADDMMWNHLVLHLGCNPNTGYSIYGVTDLGTKTTFFRGSTFLRPDQSEANPQHVIAHEMAHVYLQSRDEAVVDATAQAWMKNVAATERGEQELLRVHKTAATDEVYVRSSK
jgi:hypothetical protein